MMKTLWDFIQFFLFEYKYKSFLVRIIILTSHGCGTKYSRVHAYFLLLSAGLSKSLKGDSPPPPLKTYPLNQITLKLSTFVKSRAPRWDLFFSKQISKIAYFSAFTGQKVLTSEFFPVTHFDLVIRSHYTYFPCAFSYPFPFSK